MKTVETLEILKIKNFMNNYILIFVKPRGKC